MTTFAPDYRTDVTIVCHSCEFAHTRMQVGTSIVTPLVRRAIGHAELAQHRVSVDFSNTTYRRPR